MNRLGQLGIELENFTGWGTVRVNIDRSDLEALLAVATAVSAYQNAGLQALATSSGQGPDRAHRLEMTRCRDALAASMTPLLEEVNG